MSNGRAIAKADDFDVGETLVKVGGERSGEVRAGGDNQDILCLGRFRKDINLAFNPIREAVWPGLNRVWRSDDDEPAGILERRLDVIFKEIFGSTFEAGIQIDGQLTRGIDTELSRKTIAQQGAAEPTGHETAIGTPVANEGVVLKRRWLRRTWSHTLHQKQSRTRLHYHKAKRWGPFPEGRFPRQLPTRIASHPITRLDELLPHRRAPLA